MSSLASRHVFTAFTAPRAARFITTSAIALAAFAACGTSSSVYPLSISAADAPRAFAPIHECATTAKLEAVEHPDSINVKFDASTWIQYMIQGSQFNMVIVLGADVAGPDRPKRESDAKAKGDELYQCAVAHGLAPAAPAAPADPAAAAPAAGNADNSGSASGNASGSVSGTVTIGPGAKPTAPAAAATACSTTSCKNDNDCASSHNCTASCCQTNEVGAPCHMDNNCATSHNCTSGVCQPNTAGSACTTNTQCISQTCTSGHCK